MDIAKLRKVGGSTMLPVRPALLAALGLTAGKSVSVSLENGRLIIDPQPRYRLADLLAQTPPLAERSAQDTEWLSDAPIGRERI